MAMSAADAEQATRDAVAALQRGDAGRVRSLLGEVVRSAAIAPP